MCAGARCNSAVLHTLLRRQAATLLLLYLSTHVCCVGALDAGYACKIDVHNFVRESKVWDDYAEACSGIDGMQHLMHLSSLYADCSTITNNAPLKRQGEVMQPIQCQQATVLFIATAKHSGDGYIGLMRCRWR